MRGVELSQSLTDLNADTSTFDSPPQGQLLGDPLGDGLYEYLTQLCKGDPLQTLQARAQCSPQQLLPTHQR